MVRRNQPFNISLYIVFSFTEQWSVEVILWVKDRWIYIVDFKKWIFAVPNKSWQSWPAPCIPLLNFLTHLYQIHLFLSWVFKMFYSLFPLPPLWYHCVSVETSESLSSEVMIFNLFKMVSSCIKIDATIILGGIVYQCYIFYLILLIFMVKRFLLVTGIRKFYILHI
jgi:hypothetical protein